MCENDGVPIVITMSSARAASAARSASSRRPLAITRSSSSWVPASLNGIRPARIESRTALVVIDAEHAESRGRRSTAPAGGPRGPRPMTESDSSLAVQRSDLGRPASPRRGSEVALGRGHAAQRGQAGLGLMSADLADERDPVEPRDLALALEPGGMVGRAGPRISARIRSRSCNAKCGVEAPISWRTSSTVTSRPGTQAVWDARLGSFLRHHLEKAIHLGLDRYRDRARVADHPAVVVDGGGRALLRVAGGRVVQEEVQDRLRER